MKNIYLRFTCLTLILLAMSACKSGDSTKEDPPKEPVIIPAEYSNITISESATQSTATFTATTNWNVQVQSKATPDWITVSPMSGGAGTVTLTITPQPNTQSTERVAVIAIAAGSKSYSMTVTQKGASVQPALTINMDSKTVTDIADSFAVEVSSNVEWTARATQSWITLSPERGNKDGSVTVNYQANNTSQQRRDTIEFRASNIVRKLAVTQDAKPSPVRIEVSEVNISSVTKNSAIGVSSVSSSDESAITESGICWHTESDPTINHSKSQASAKVGEFSLMLNNLKESTVYYTRAYAVHSAGVVYGAQKSFTTAASTSKPTVTTGEISEITSNSAICGAQMTDNGGEAPSALGLCWSGSPNPTIDDFLYIAPQGAIAFEGGILSNLTPLSTYYVRAFATNSAGTAYGQQRTFTTKSNISLDTRVLFTLQTSLTVATTLTTNDVSKIREIGVCYSLTKGATINNTKIAAKEVYGGFSTELTGLRYSTLYYINSYVILHDNKVIYGDEISAKTLGDFATISTTAPTEITKTSITIGGNITNDGGDEIIKRGVCWSTKPNPTTDMVTKTEQGTGKGKFISTITNLKPVTVYYIRAYAVNASGVAYGEQIEVSTKGGGEISDFDKDDNEF